MGSNTSLMNQTQQKKDSLPEINLNTQESEESSEEQLGLGDLDLGQAFRSKKSILMIDVSDRPLDSLPSR